MSKCEDHKRHHYIPQCYLRQFGHSNGKEKHENFFLYVYNVNKDKQYTQSTEKVCCRDFFYSISKEYIEGLSDNEIHELSIEVDFFANCIENNLNIILTKVENIKKNCFYEHTTFFPIHKNDKYIIAKQIVIQYLRHPNVREDILSFDDYVTSKALRLFKYGLSKELNKPDINNIDIQVKRFDSETHARYSFLNNKLVDELATKLSLDNWMFVYSQSNEICTSDNPVVCLSKSIDNRLIKCELNNNVRLVIYAISQDLLLLIFDKNSFTCTDFTFGEITEYCLKMYHEALFNQSNLIFCYNNNFDFFKKLNNAKTQITNC